MKLFEVVRGAKTLAGTLATAMELGRKIGKISALAAIATASSPTAPRARSAPR